MSITAEVREDYENLFKPLVTINPWKVNLKRGLFKTSRTKAENQNLKIQESE